MKNLCPLPWVGFSNDPNGTVRACCIYKEQVTKTDGTPFFVQKDSVKEIFHSEYMENLRNQFRNGERPKGCETCWKDEDNGYKSKRQIYQEITEKFNSEFSYDRTPDYPEDYQIILTNACNLKCRSCGTSHSTSWQKELKDVPREVQEIIGVDPYPLPNGQAGGNSSRFFNEMDEWLPNVKRIEVVGGEPFYAPAWEKVWNEMIDRGFSKDVTLHMSTNGTFYKEELLLKLIKNFKNVGIGLSIDGMGKTFEYLRKNAIWDEVVKNIDKFYRVKLKYPDKVSFTFTHTTSWLNALNLPEYFDWTNNNTEHFGKWVNIIHHPHHMALYMLPENVKHKIKTKWEAYDFGQYQNDINALVKFMYSKQPSEEELVEHYRKFTVLDKYRGDDSVKIITDIYPELVKYFD